MIVKHRISSVAQLLKRSGEGGSLHTLLQSEGLEKEDANDVGLQISIITSEIQYMERYLRSCKIKVT